MRRLPTVLSCLVFLGLVLAHTTASADPPRKYREAKHRLGELKYVNGLPVLIVQGTPEEIGEQKAVLTAEVAMELIDYPRDLLRMLHREDCLPQLLELGERLLPQFPKDHLRELEAFARVSGVDRKMLIGVNTMVDTYRGGFGCSSLLVEGSRSATGGPLFGRNLDFVTLGKLQHYNLVEIHRPEGKYAFCCVGFPGMLGCFSGMNEKGLAVAVHEVYLAKDRSPMFSPQGTPYTFFFRRILEECSSVGEAEKLVRSLPRTTRLNLAVCDRKQAAVFELTPLTVAVRRADDGICVCTNHFRTGELEWIILPHRYKILSQARSMPTLTVADVARKLHEVHQGPLTLQTMVFEPEELVLHLAVGECPSSALPLKRLELAPLLTERPAIEVATKPER